MLFVRNRIFTAKSSKLGDVRSYSACSVPLPAVLTFGESLQLPHYYYYYFTHCTVCFLLPLDAADSLPVADGTLRLSGDRVESDTMGAGRLEISYYGRWMTVCSTYFSSEAAEVACRQLGFTSVVDVCRNSSW